MDEIVNKVAQSSLQVFDLEDFYPKENIIELDISLWLEHGFLLKEKEFREALKTHDWSQYQNQLVALTNNNEAIVPAWTFILITSYLGNYASFVTLGSKEDLLKSFYQNAIENHDFTQYQDKPVILKGCSKKQVPEQAYLFAQQKLQIVAKSIMFGEACSAVPIFKKSKI